MGLTPSGPTLTSFKNAPGVFVLAVSPGCAPAFPPVFLMRPNPLAASPLSLSRDTIAGGFFSGNFYCWKAGKLESWKAGKLESWKVGKLKC
jgi:hypothetical protein